MGERGERGEKREERGERRIKRKGCVCVCGLVDVERRWELKIRQMYLVLHVPTVFFLIQHTKKVLSFSSIGAFAPPPFPALRELNAM